MKRFISTVPCLILAAASAFAQNEPQRSIVHVAGDLYRAQNDAHYSVFLVTSEGIIVADPINGAFAGWLKRELAARFDQPVRFVIYSHTHWDHVSGGGVFADTAAFVGHEAARENLDMPPVGTRLPDDALAMDRDSDGQIAISEAAGNLRQNFALFDADADGFLKGAEVVRGPIADIQPPQVLFTDAGGTLSLGGKTVELIHIGPVHSPDMMVLRFPEERALFLVDFVSVRRLPYRDLGVMDVDGTSAAIRKVEAMDFDIVVGGHGDIGRKGDLAAFRHYLDELRDEVAAGIADGKSLEELKTSITMASYSDWANYDEWLPLNIEGMYRALSDD